MNLLRVALALFVTSAFAGLGCSSSGARAGGASCTSSADCTSGACLDLAVTDVDGGNCRSAGKACSKECSVDGDCASLGAKFKCFQGCGATMTCGATL